MQLWKKLKKPWASTKKELKKQFPNFKFSGRYTIFSLLILVGYLIHLNNFLTSKPTPQFVPISLAQENVLAVNSTPTPTIVVVITPPPTGRVVRVPVLMYHYIQNSDGRDGLTQDLSVSPEMIDAQLNYLVTQGFTSISPEELYLALVKNQPLPSKPIMLTFDDGYRDFYTQAYPLLKKYQIKATNFVPIGLVDRPYYLTTSQVKELGNDPLITLASHTLHHPDLPLSTRESAWDEIFQGKVRLEAVIGKKVDYFAYPFGAFNERIVNQVKESGFKMAFTTQVGRTHSETTLLVQPRVRVGGTQSLETFKEKLP